MRLLALAAMLLSFVLLTLVNAEQASKPEREQGPARQHEDGPEAPSNRIEINVGNPPNTQPL
jgi:hypothetical protein